MAKNSETTVGVGLRAPHAQEMMRTGPDLDLLEVHSENYFGDGAGVSDLLALRRDYPVSLHGVGLSMGSIDSLNKTHLRELRALVHKTDPIFVSEHLSWGSVDGVHFNDLLPLPYTEEALVHFCRRVTQVQDILGRRILIENPSSYLRYTHSTISESDFLLEVSQRTGAGLLVDINNIYVSATNLGFDAALYISSLPGDAVDEVHLAGHTVNTYPEGEILIDDHGSPVSDSVWQLFSHAIDRWGNKPTIIEWDTQLPELSGLLLESDLARQRQKVRREVA